MSVRCDACHRVTAPGRRYCPEHRRKAENRTLDAFTDDTDTNT